MNDSEKKRQDQEYLVKLADIYQRIGMAGALVSWIIVWALGGLEIGLIIACRTWVWMVLVAVQYFTLNDLLVSKIHTVMLRNPYVIVQVQKSKILRNFVFLGALVFWLKDCAELQIPFIFTIVGIVFIFSATKIVYNASELPG